MANRSNRSELPRLFSGRAVFVAFVTLSVVTGACSSDERRIAIGAGETDEDAGALAPPRFDGPEDAGDASSTTSDASREGIAMCVATECPYPFGTCGGTSGTNNTYACGTNLLADRNNCGTCGNACPQASAFPELNMDTQCVDGACQRQCVPRSGVQYGDCNGLVDDGCETNLGNDPDHCGACGNACPAGPDGARRCINGQCGCPIGQTWCDSRMHRHRDRRHELRRLRERAREPTRPPPPNMGTAACRAGAARCSGRADCSGKIRRRLRGRHRPDSKNLAPAGTRARRSKGLPKGNIVACGCEPSRRCARAAAGSSARTS